MMNLKPSELPSETVIADEELGWYIKGTDGDWGELYPHCVDCAGDDDVAKNEADERFTDFRIVALPISVVEDIAYDAAFARGMTISQVISQAIKTVNDEAD